MPDSRPAAPDSFCPQCRGPVSQATGGLCLRCLGEIALRSDEPSPEPAEDFAPDFTLSTTGERFARDALRGTSTPSRVGAYTIIEEVGRGGMGIVYAARHETLGRVVALKTLSAAHVATVEQQTRFVREAQTAARLRHPHVVTVHDAGVADGIAFFTMDLVTDGDLAARLRAQPLPPRVAADLLRKVATAVAYAHREGVLHRDLKPSNILLEGDEPRVADFGLAAQLEPGGDLTAGTRVLGTPAYLAPEIQLRGSGASSRASDVYALGAMLYEALTGRPPFFGDAAPLTLHREPVAPRLLAPSLPRDLETIVLKALQPNPAARFAGAAEFAEDLARFLEGRPILTRPPSAVGRFARWCRRRPALAATWFLLATLALGATVATVLVARARQETRLQLAAAQLAEARAHTLTRRMGRRADALAAIAAAARIRPSVDLRNAAIIALAQPDADVVQTWPINWHGFPIAFFDPSGRSYVLLHSTGMAWREVGTDREWARLVSAGNAPALGLPGFSPDGQRMVMHSSDQQVHLWERDASGARIRWSLTDRPYPWPRPVPLYGGDVTHSPDGTRVTAATAGGGFSLHDAADGQEIGRWASEHLPTRIRWSPDGTTLAVASAAKASAGRLHLVDAATLTTRHTFAVGSNIFDVAWTTTGQVVAASTEENEVRVYRASDGVALRTFHTGQRRVELMGFLGRELELLTSTGLENTFRWRSAETGEDVLTIPGVQANAFTIAHDGATVLTTNGQNAGRILRMLQPVGVQTFPADREQVNASHAGPGSLSFSRDGRWLCATASGFLSLTRLADAEVAAQLRTGTPRELVTAQFSADGNALYVCGTVEGFSHVALHHDDDTVRLGERTIIDATPDSYLRDLSDDGTRLALVSPRRGRVKVFALDQGNKPQLLSEWETAGPYGAAFGAAGQQLLVNHDDSVANFPGGTLRVWDIATGQAVHTLAAPLSADADWNDRARVAITTNGPNESVLWRAESWTRGAPLPVEARGNFTCFSLSPDGMLVAIGTGAGVHVVDTASGQSLALLNRGVALGFANAVLFSPDGHKVAAQNGDGLVHVWDLPTLRAALKTLQLDW